MHRSISLRRVLILLACLLRSAILCAPLLLLVRIGPALAQGVVVPAEDVNPALAKAAADSALHIVNELSNRRRLTTFFANEQSPFYGVQINYVNVGRGNLTFLNRDLVRLDRIPIVAGRVYDSRLEAESDFGPGWKLSVTEVVSHRGNMLRYLDASGSVYELQLEGNTIVSPHPHLTGITGGRRLSGEIELRTSHFTKRFANIRGQFYLSTVTDIFGNSLTLEYSGTLVSRISSQHGRYVEIVRDGSGRIASMRDDTGRTVDYHYDAAGQLFSVVGAGSAQWRYRYNASGYLRGATDPRGIDALTAAYAQGGRVSDVRVLYDVRSFSYQGSATVVRNGLQQAATFWHDASGLTHAIQDFEGATSQIAFDSTLRPASLSFNGSIVAALQYGDNGQIQGVRSSIEGRPRMTRFSYDDAERLAAVVADNQRIARYTYDATGRVRRAEDAATQREYEYFGTTGYQVRLGETELDIETNSFGLMSSFSNGHQSVAVSYNELDQVSELQYVTYGDVYEVAYGYGASGLRSTGSYVLAEDQPAPASLSLDYDVVGNLTNLTVDTPTGARSSQTYVLGMNNQLTRLMNPRRSDLVFGYDSAGRPTRRTLGTNDVRYEYDASGRINAVYERDRKILQWRYGFMDVDAATEADDHTPWTAVNEPTASAIFGSAESIAYTRTRGTPFGPIRFSSSMARFVLPAQLVPSPDSVLLVSLQRRNVPLSSDHYASANPAPLAFDKPSNALFLPPEFSSLNCYMCTAWIAGGGTPTMTINGSSANPVVVPYGNAENIYVTASGQCWGDVHYWNSETNGWEGDTVQGLFTHTFLFGDGNSDEDVTGGTSANKSKVYTHFFPGFYTVSDYISCGCADGTMMYDYLPVAERNVLVTLPPSCSQADTDGYNGSGLLGRNATIASRYYVHQSSFANSIFRFKFIANANDIPAPGDQSTVASQASRWNALRSLCGESYTSEITYSWATNFSVNIRVTIDPAVSPAYGDQLDNGCGGLDCIRLNPNRPTTTFAHEIGHALGFLHSQTTTDIMCNACSDAEARDIQGWHIAKLLNHYAQYF
jgi:YD repeat-containing protein